MALWRRGRAGVEGIGKMRGMRGGGRRCLLSCDLCRGVVVVAAGMEEVKEVQEREGEEATADMGVGVGVGVG